MAELVGGAFLSSFLQVAFQKLASHDFRDYFRRRQMDDGLLRKLHFILLSVDRIVEDAEERQYRHRSVKQWLDELKDEVFKAQDLLDDIATEALRQKLDAESQTVIIGKVRGFFTGLVNRNQSEKKIEARIKGVLNNLENLIKQNEILGLRGGPSAGIESGVHKSVYKRLPSTRLIDESDMHGRDADKERIVELLLSQSMGGNQLPMDVIAITGMGGMGKTTLAKLVYEDVKVKDQFEHRAWVCVSEEFDVHQVTKATLQSLNCPTEQLHDLVHLFWWCDNMKRINHRGLVHLHSLTSLSFVKCGRMSFEGMPEDGLPPSLSHLSIFECPLLKERCEKERGPDWPIIAHIPHIHMH